MENLLAKLKDWRRLATRDNRCAHILLSAVLLAVTVTFRFRGLGRASKMVEIRGG